MHGSDGHWAANHTRNMPAILGSYYGLLDDELAEEMHIGFTPIKVKEVGRVLSALTCCAMVVSRNACMARRGEAGRLCRFHSDATGRQQWRTGRIPSASALLMRAPDDVGLSREHRDIALRDRLGLLYVDLLARW